GAGAVEHCLVALLSVARHRYPVDFHSGANRNPFCFYQLALRRPGTSPRMVASRSLLRPSPKRALTARGLPVSAQRVRTREGLASRGSFCSLACAAIFSS